MRKKFGVVVPLPLKAMKTIMILKIIRHQNTMTNLSIVTAIQTHGMTLIKVMTLIRTMTLILVMSSKMMTLRMIMKTNTSM